MNLKNFTAKVNSFLFSCKYFCKNLQIFYIFLISFLQYVDFPLYTYYCTIAEISPV